MYKHSRNLSTGGGSLKDEVQTPGYPLPKLRRKHSEGDILDAATGASSMSTESNPWLNHGSSGGGGAYDEIDSLPSSLRFNFFDITCIIFSMITYTLDLGMDLYIAYIYYTGQWIAYFILTLCFVIIPAGTMTAFSLRWYVMDMDIQVSRKPSSGRWIIRTIILLLQLAPVLRYVDSLIYGLKSRQAAAKNDKIGQLKYYTLMVNEDADATLLRLFEGFMESAPQVTLQLYIFMTYLGKEDGPFTGNRNIQVGAILSSLVSLAWSLSSYHRSLRYAQPDKSNISYKGTILQFLWHFFSISARVFALAVFASSYPVFIVPVCIVHWVIMLGWLIFQGNTTCGNQCEEVVFILVVAFVYIFTFFNIRDEPTRYKYLVYYIICFVENSILLLIWFFSPNLPPFTLQKWDEYNFQDNEMNWFRIYGLASDFALFFLGIIAMILYYVYFHPSLTDKLFLKTYDIEKDTPHRPLPEPTRPPIRTDFLNRRGSLDQSSIPLSIAGAGSNPSSRRNVTFAMDLRKPREKATRSNSCGDPAPAKDSVSVKSSSSAKAQNLETNTTTNNSQSQPLLTAPQSRKQTQNQSTEASSNGVKSTKETKF